LNNADNQLPGKGLLGWLGRQVGYITGAAKHDVTAESKTIYQKQTIHEQPLPQQPNVTLRRTTIDEVIERKSEAEA